MIAVKISDIEVLNLSVIIFFYKIIKPTKKLKSKK